VRPMALIAGLATLAAGLTGCSNHGSGSAAAPGTTQAACGRSRTAQAYVATVPMTVSTQSDGMLPLVGVCVGRSGPYRFVVDSGSSRSIIDSTLASNLGLKGAGPVGVGGSGCATTGTLVQVPAMRISAIALTAQSMISAPLTNWSGVSVDGVLGSDVLGRFDAVTLDFTKQTLTVLGAEGPPPTSHQIVEGQGTEPLPSSLYGGVPTVEAALTIIRSPGTIAASVATTVAGHGPYEYVVDTGSPVSGISAAYAFKDGIADNGKGTAPGGIGCSEMVPNLASTPVKIGSSTLPIPAPRAITISGPLRTGLEGYLGVDALGTKGAIVIDYQGATLALGPG
jgi:hypothetical protein